MNDERLATRVGAVTLVALLIAVALVLSLQDVHLRRGRTVFVDMARIGALQVGGHVKLAGLELGTVEAIRLVPAKDASQKAHARLQLWIDRRYAWLVRTSSEFFLSQQGLFGETHLEVTAGPPAPELEDGATVKGVDPPPIEELMGKSYRNLKAATELFRDGVPEIDALRRALVRLDQTIASLESAPGDAVVAGLAVRRFHDETQALKLEFADWTRSGRALDRAVRANLPELGQRLGRFATTMRPLLARIDDPRLRRLVDTIDRIAPLIGEIERAEATVDYLYTRLAAGQGSLGAFLQDVELGDEIKDALQQLKREPWRALGHP